MASWAELFGGSGGQAEAGTYGRSGGTGQQIGMGGGDPQGQGGYLAQLLQRMKANRGDFFINATEENAGAGSLSGAIGGGGRARGGVVSNTPGIVQLLSLLANRNRQF